MDSGNTLLLVEVLENTLVPTYMVTHNPSIPAHTKVTTIQQTPCQPGPLPTSPATGTGRILCSLHSTPLQAANRHQDSLMDAAALEHP